MKLIKVFVVATTSLLFLACPTNDDDFNPDATASLVNNADFDIVSVSLPYEDKNELPISSPFRNEELLDASTIKQNSSISFRIETSVVNNEGFALSLLSREVVETVPWDQIREEKLVLKTFDLTLEELEAMEYTLAYP